MKHKRLSFLCLPAVLVCLATAGLLPSIDAAAPCPGFTVVPGQGPSCPVLGGWLVLLGDGTTLLTHGPDEVASGGSGAADFAARAMPTCVADPANEPKAFAIYAFPPPSVEGHAGLGTHPQFNNHADTRVPEIRDMVNRSNAYLASEAAKYGVNITFKFTCDAADMITVAVAQLKTPWLATSFHTIATELQLMGFNKPLTKYWVFYELMMGPIAGQGSISNDDRAAADNEANGKFDFAMVYGRTGTQGVHVMVHEAFHTMGAVQNSAPNSSGAFHCNDGWDTMCYADGGPKSNYTTTACPAEVLDCNHDDYFWPGAPAGTYPGDHWNVGSSLNAFITYS